MCYLPPLQKSAENRIGLSYISTVSFRLYRTELLPPPVLPFGFSFLPVVSAGRSSPFFSCCLTLFLLRRSPFLHLTHCECKFVRWRERKKGLSPLLYRDPLSASCAPSLCASVFVCMSVFLCVCVYSMHV